MLAVGTTLPLLEGGTTVEVDIEVREEFEELRAVEPDNWLVRRLLIVDADIGPYLLSAGNTGAVFVRRSAGACAMLGIQPIRVLLRFNRTPVADRV